MDNNLKAFGKNRKWLFRKIKEHGYSNVEDIFLLVSNSNGEVTIYEKGYQVGKGVLE